MGGRVEKEKRKEKERRKTDTRLDRLAEVARIGRVLEGVSADEHDVQGDAARPDVGDLERGGGEEGRGVSVLVL